MWNEEADIMAAAKCLIENPGWDDIVPGYLGRKVAEAYQRLHAEHHTVPAVSWEQPTAPVRDLIAIRKTMELATAGFQDIDPELDAIYVEFAKAAMNPVRPPRFPMITAILGEKCRVLEDDGASGWHDLRKQADNGTYPFPMKTKAPAVEPIKNREHCERCGNLMPEKPGGSLWPHFCTVCQKFLVPAEEAKADETTSDPSKLPYIPPPAVASEEITAGWLRSIMPKGHADAPGEEPGRVNVITWADRGSLPPLVTVNNEIYNSTEYQHKRSEFVALCAKLGIPTVDTSNIPF